MARNAAGDEELFLVRKVGNAFRRRRSIRPRPCWKLVNEVVARKDELFWGDLPRVAEGGGVRDGSPAIPQGVECRVNGALHDDASMVKITPTDDGS